MAKARVEIPRNVQDLLELAEFIRNKHEADGESSVLNALQDQNWSDLSPKLTQCLQLHLRAEELRRQMELTYRERDLLLKPIDGTVRASRDLLTGVYRVNPKRLGEWGFKVSDRPVSRINTPNEPVTA